MTILDPRLRGDDEKQMNLNRNKKGFTLLELLIVVAILAVLGAIVLFVLNPAETLKKTRDSQRISDLSTIKSAVSLFITSTTSAAIGNSHCYGQASPNIFYTSSQPSTSTAPGWIAATSATPGNTSGTGWIPVALDALIGGSPISNWPVDPTNTVAGATPTSTDLVYRYACNATSTTFESAATLESAAYSGMMSTDGGDDNLHYQVGTQIKNILPSAGNY